MERGQSKRIGETAALQAFSRLTRLYSSMLADEAEVIRGFRAAGKILGCRAFGIALRGASGVAR
jgi:hypothetical protein